MNIAIFYSVYINTYADWRSVINRQIDDIKIYGLFEHADFYISVINPNNERFAVEFIRERVPINTEISEFIENTFEYREIKNLWEVCSSQNDPYDIVAYFHTKGMSYAKKAETK